MQRILSISSSDGGVRSDDDAEVKRQRVAVVFKRDGREEKVDVQKIQHRVDKLARKEPPLRIDTLPIVQSVVSDLADGITTEELDKVAVANAANLVTVHPDYGRLASRIATSNMHKTTTLSFHDLSKMLWDSNILSDEMMALITRYASVVKQTIEYSRDYTHDVFATETLKKAYLLTNDKMQERPQDMYMRVALWIYGVRAEGPLSVAEEKLVIEAYDRFSKGECTHASPTIFNAGTNAPQLASCFLISMKDDSIEGIYDTLKQCALISKGAGGIGVDVTCVRASGSRISNFGVSSGIGPMLKCFEDTARHVNQSGKRKGAFAIYLEPWHADVEGWLDLVRPQTVNGCPTLFLGLWVCDEFMRRVQAAVDFRERHGTTLKNWSLFCPNEAPGLNDCFGEKFDELYRSYEEQGLARKTISAEDLMMHMLMTQKECGHPYFCFKDTANKHANQDADRSSKGEAVIRCSNLCAEIMEATVPGREVAVCNLASVALSKMIVDGSFDFKKLQDVVRMLTIGLNNTIDVGSYPIEMARTSNIKHRPIGIGVQGLADTFAKLNMPFESEEARTLNREIFECMYYSALSASCELAKTHGAHDSFASSRLAEGVFHWELFQKHHGPVPLSGRWDWEALRCDISAHGTRNSLLIAIMPTATTAQILGNSECIEPRTTNAFVRRVLAGEFSVVNEDLIDTLVKDGVWNEDLRLQLIRDGGSVQDMPIDPALKELYKTAYEVKQSHCLRMAADRAPFIDQSESHNVFFDNPSMPVLFSHHMQAWKTGLKTGMYYLKMPPAGNTSQFTVNKTEPIQEPIQATEVCTRDGGCTMCSA